MTARGAVAGRLASCYVSELDVFSLLPLISPPIYNLNHLTGSGALGKVKGQELHGGMEGTKNEYEIERGERIQAYYTLIALPVLLALSVVNDISI